MSTISPNMGLVIPAVGQDYGPAWAQNINSSLSILDGHSHVSGSGVPITPSAISMTSDLSFNSKNATTLRTTRYVSQGSALSTASDVSCLYVVNGNLYFNYDSSTPVQITTGSSVNGSAGTITGLPSGTAGAAFTAISGTFVFTQSTGSGANMDSGTLIVRNPGSYPVPAGNFVAIQAPSSFTSAGYSITLPSGVPSVSASPLLMDTAGNVSAGTPGSYFNPAGIISAFGGTSAPTGWLLCDGSAISRTGYAALFAAIGTAYGYGDNSTTFNIPDLRGQFLRGVTGASSNDPDASTRTAMNTGGNTGNAVGSVQASQFASHNHTGATGVPSSIAHYHTYPTDGDNGNQNNNRAANGNGTGGTHTNTVSSAVDQGLGSHTHTISSQGGNQTNPINAYVNFIIKT